jgi:hypothetical protein
MAEHFFRGFEKRAQEEAMEKDAILGQAISYGLRLGAKPLVALGKSIFKGLAGNTNRLMNTSFTMMDAVGNTQQAMHAANAGKGALQSLRRGEAIV